MSMKFLIIIAIVFFVVFSGFEIIDEESCTEKHGVWIRFGTCIKADRL